MDRLHYVSRMITSWRRTSLVEEHASKMCAQEEGAVSFKRGSHCIFKLAWMRTWKFQVCFERVHFFFDILGHELCTYHVCAAAAAPLFEFSGGRLWMGKAPCLCAGYPIMNVVRDARACRRHRHRDVRGSARVFWLAAPPLCTAARVSWVAAPPLCLVAHIS